MAITKYDFVYDKQIVRFLEQLVRAFSGFSYQTGTVAGQPPQTVMVPCRMASTNRMVANLLTNMSENALLTVPLITVYQTGLRGRREDLQNPTHIDQRQVFERNIQTDGTYGSDVGNAYSVDRIMPTPFLLEATVDIWTSNLQQKYMLIEQILPAIYPQFEIQNSANPLDWTAVTICVVDDDFTFSSRSIPVGTNDEIDIMSIHLTIPIWLSPPAKVKNLRRIEEVIANIALGVDDPVAGSLEMGTPVGQVVVTPEDAFVSVSGQTITLLGPKAGDTMKDGTAPSWRNLANEYGGSVIPTVSKLKLFIDGRIEGAAVTGTIQYTSTPGQVMWTIDPTTLPVNTLPAVNAVIEPTRSFPGMGGLAPAVDGQRYLLINGIGDSVAWGNLTAATNDIIQYNGTTGTWFVSFQSAGTTATQFVLNGFSGRQLRWTGSSWAMAIDGVYEPGHWRLALGVTAGS